MTQRTLADVDQPSIFEQGMTPNQRAVLHAIMGRNRNRPISIREISDATGLKDRTVKKIVSELNVEHKMPIGSSKEAPTGYFWCSTKEDRIAAARTIIQQIRRESVRVRSLLEIADIRELDGQERMFADALFQGQVA